MSRIIKAAAVVSEGLAYVFLIVGAIAAAPFAIVGLWLDNRADDLRDGYRRGRQQNWLWRFAQRHGQ